MTVRSLAIPEVLVFEPQTFRDDRGWFRVLYNCDAMAKAGLRDTFVQDNISFSARGVLRGLHWQVPIPQGKLVTCVTGRVFDVAVDIRPDSPTFSQWVSEELDAERGNAIWVPPGFAHGFLVLSDTSHVLYRNTAGYIADGQRSLRFDAPEIGIEWPDTGTPVSLSPKDEDAMSWAEYLRVGPQG
ncbi:MAG: dTDP-4-dehydrorhamnose 3,5-epimerase [Fimbriimonadaceae bacterium]|nr:dTDP-4-dehydrorhamnose 3,5-epimerase [Fimbriimonadaceae bacterium]